MVRSNCGVHASMRLTMIVCAAAHAAGAAADMVKIPVMVGESAELLPMERGDVLIHTERTVHGSGPNMSNSWRCVGVGLLPGLLPCMYAGLHGVCGDCRGVQDA